MGKINIKPIRPNVSCPTGAAFCRCPGTGKPCPRKYTKFKYHGKTCTRNSCDCNKCVKLLPRKVMKKTRQRMTGNTSRCWSRNGRITHTNGYPGRGWKLNGPGCKKMGKVKKFVREVSCPMGAA